MNSLYNLTNLDKELWPNITKKDLITYLIYVGPVMKEYLTDLPLSLIRAPDGVNEEMFFQKNLPDYAPDLLKTWEFIRGKKKTRYLIINSVKDFVYLGNQACVEIHSMLSTTQSIEKPKELVVDLDPKEGTDFLLVKKGALIVKEILDMLGVVSQPKITGKKGIHIMIPIQPEYSYTELEPFFKAFKELVVNKHPELFTGHLRKEKRDAPIFFDMGQNGLEKTVIAPYSPRATLDATVAAFVTWEELEKMQAKPAWSVKKDSWPPLTSIRPISQVLPRSFLG